MNQPSNPNNRRPPSASNHRLHDHFQDQLYLTQPPSLLHSFQRRNSRRSSRPPSLLKNDITHTPPASSSLPAPTHLRTPSSSLSHSYTPHDSGSPTLCQSTPPLVSPTLPSPSPLRPDALSSLASASASFEQAPFDDSVSNASSMRPMPSSTSVTASSISRKARGKKKVPEQRRIYLNTPIPEHDQSVRFTTNGVKTTKYTPLTFIPKNLWEQFRHVANFFFLVIVILQFIPDLQVGNPFFGAVPFAFILSVSAVKDGIEDFRRYLEDRTFNNTCTLVLSNWKNVNPVYVPFLQRCFTPCMYPFRKLKTCFTWLFPWTKKKGTASSSHKPATGSPCWKPKPWHSIRVGDIVYLQNNECIPADILILSTSEPEHVCYVETKSLDGETNLKLKRATQVTRSLATPADCANFQAILQADAPMPLLSHFMGTLLTLHSKTFVSLPSLLLRGCMLRNTTWVIGMVVYTGEDTKLVLNSGSTPSKRTQIDKKLNPHVIINFLILFTMSVVSTITNTVYNAAFDFEGAVFDSESQPTTLNKVSLAIVTFFLSLIVFQTLVPISLFVTTEVVKTVQAYFIHSDIELYDADRDIPCVAHSWNLADDLGQVEYVFSDKTGTLTMNEMVFHACSIRGVMYGEASSMTDTISRQTHVETFERLLLQQVQRAFQYDTSSFPRKFSDLHLIPFLKQQDSDAQFFFLTLALCHTVLPEKVTDQQAQRTYMTYKAQSPDEEALVAAAHHVGITFLSRSQHSTVVDVLGTLMEFQVLEIFEFDSTRKRMSVLLLHPQHRQVLVLCKGADSVIFERLHPGQGALQETTLQHLQYFSNEGLRTLCLAYRYLDHGYFLQWHQRYQAVMAHLDHPNRQEKIEQLVSEIESELVLLGATAIEDKLQDQVPETIQSLLDARLKVWVLTGDKLETAISIGFSCHLLKQSMTLIVIQGDALEEIRRQLEDSFHTLLGIGQRRQCRSEANTVVETVQDHLMREDEKFKDVLEREKRYSAASEPVSDARFALVIDGAALKHALEPELKLLFLEVGCRCTSVICCRVSPKQKAEVVALVKKELNCLTLSIGDGANDVSMLYEANIGIGIAGVEGCQAALASDFAITQFKHLQRLLFVHGRWNYRRVGLMCLLFFYKNVTFVMAMFWFQFFSGFSSSPLFEYSYITYYNAVFTVLPAPLLGIFDQDIHARMALRYPQLYSEGPVHRHYNHILFWSYIVDGLYQSVIVFFFIYCMHNDAIVASNGLSHGALEMGTVMVAMITVMTTAFSYFHIKNWVWFTFVVSALSFAVFPVFLCVTAAIPGSQLVHMPAMVLGTSTLWYAMPLILLCALAPRVLFDYYCTHFPPYSVDHTLLKLRHRAQPSEPLEMRARSTSRPQWMLDSMVSSFQETMLSVMDFTKRGFRRGSRPFAQRAYTSAVLMHMSTGQRSVLPNTGFAFSADPGLPSEIHATRDVASDSHVNLFTDDLDGRSSSHPPYPMISRGHQRKSTI